MLLNCFSGTSVGDPIEYESIQSAFGDGNKDQPLFLGSIKGNIGHTEATSGVAGVIKTLLMVQRGAIPKQANFKSLNPRIKPIGSRKIEIPTVTQAWTASPRVALVNNYGAAGSNAAILIRQHEQLQYSDVQPAGVFPVTLSARSKESLERQVRTLREYLAKRRPALSDVAQNASKRQNPLLTYRAGLATSELESLLDSLSSFQSTSNIDPVKTGRPVILVFGGQTGQTISLSRELYDESDLLQKHVVGDMHDELLFALSTTN